MEDATTPRSRLVGQPLLYAISVFASLGVFLVRLSILYLCLISLIIEHSLGTTKGTLSVAFVANEVLTLPQCDERHNYWSLLSKVF